MNTFISLVTFTEEGARSVHDSPARADAFIKNAEKEGVSITGLYWTEGAFDGIIIFQASDEATATALMVGLCSKGFVKTQTMRAFDAAEFQGVLTKAHTV